MSEERKEWSIVMTEFSGDWWQFNRAVESVFGRDDLDVYELCCINKEQHLPCELASDLVYEEASGIAAQLSDAGAEVGIVRSAELPEVKHTADDIWATRCVDGFCFIEVKRLITFGSSLSKRHILRWIDTSPIWEQERGLNHEHPADGGTPSEEAIKLENEYIDKLKTTLKQAFPDRVFTIAYIPEGVVTFWQTTEDSPREPSDGEQLIFVGPDING